MKPVFILLAFLVWGESKAEQIFLLFDDSCGNRIRYERTVGDASRMDYYSYSFPVGSGTDLILETDGEGAAHQSTLPERYLSCNDLRLTSDLADRINTGETHLFILLTDREGLYQVQPVVMAALFGREGNAVSYRSPFADFAFTTDNPVIGVNLDRGSEGAAVYFEGSEGTDCRTGFLFQQQNPSSAYPIIDYKLIPSLGITERRLTGNGSYSKGGNIQAVEVNGEPLQEYLDTRCATQATADGEPEVTYTETQTNFVPYYVESESPSTYTQQAPVLIAGESQTKAVPYDGPAPVAAPVVIHQVTPGETLYAISRRYGLSVNTIKAENGLRDNTIFVGQELRIASQEPVAEEFIGEEAEYSYDEDPVYRPEPAAPSTNPYPVVPPPASSYPALPVSTPAAVSGTFHTVLAGETIASLALRYGYTTARFREFNQLGNQEVALVGQRLRTSDCTCPPPATPSAIPQPAAEVAPPPRPSNYVSPAPESGVVAERDYVDTYPTPVPVERTPVNIVVPPARTAPAAATNNPPAYGGGVRVNPGGNPTTSAPYGSAVPTTPADRRATHSVRDGESLYGISRQYGMTVEQLRELNNLQPADVIVPFQKLYVN